MLFLLSVQKNKKVLALFKKICYCKQVIKTQENIIYATVVQLVVRHLAKVEVAGSSPVCRSQRP